MLLVADSGSSKTDWKLLLPNGDTQNFQTAGINPIFSSEKEIFRILSYQNQFGSFSAQVREIYFFGAGCNHPDRREFVSNALSSKFPNAFCSVESDLSGAAYATCGKETGLNCIIGTESNISFFDGNEITEINNGLGYILEDEGSGSYFGKKLITDFLYGKMPSDLADKFYAEYKINKETVIESVYKKPLPNFHLASYALFMSPYQDMDYIKTILLKGFDDYVANNIVTYPAFKTVNTHFVGSIAHHYQEALLEVCNKYEVKVGKILEKPIEALFEFIKDREEIVST
jgi:N-acetylglucosamine kinase-like BadF-type ATPase